MNEKLIDILWIIVASGLVFFMQAGFALLESGLTRSKNSINVSIKNLTDLGVSVLLFWAFGFALMFGESHNGWIGLSNFFVSSNGNLWLAAFFLFQAMFCSTAATIVSGAVAERMKYSSYIVTTIILSALIYPIFGHWAWGGVVPGTSAGWLSKMGFVDFAGSTVVHSIGGWISLAAILVIGPRSGKFPKDGPPKKIHGSNIPAAVVGVIILWFGWFGFNGGSTLAMNRDVASIIVNTSLSTAGGMVVSIFIGWLFYKIANVTFVINGALAGLVAITAGCHSVNESQSVIIGAVGGIVALLCGELLERLKIDDAVGAIPVHLAAGVWGTFSVAIFGNAATLGTGLTFFEQLKVQALGIATCGLWSFFVAYIIFKIINKFWKLRVSPEDEYQGLNITEHGASTELYDLFSVMEKHAMSGDLSGQVPEEPFTEVGQIAKRYNYVTGRLQENMIAKSEYLNILDNVNDGLLLVDRDFKIGSYYSKVLENILSKKDLSEENLISLLNSIMTEENKETVENFFKLLFNENIEFRTINKLNPLSSIEVFIGNNEGNFDSKYLRFSFKRIIDNEKIVRLMIVIRDITESIKLSMEMEKTKKSSKMEMELLYKIIHIDPQMFNEFIDSVNEELILINDILERSKENNHQKLNKIFRAVHSIKGDANILGLDFIGEKAHEMEDKISELKSKDKPKNSDFISLALLLSELQQVINQSGKLIDKITKFQNTFAMENMKNKEILIMSIERLIERLSKNLGKKINFVSDNFNTKDIPDTIRKKIKDILVQFSRNSIYHGIEEPEIRVQKGKNENGIIEISTVKDDKNIYIKFKDDGKGIDIENVKERALKSGKWSAEEIASWDRKNIIKLIFKQGLSTAREADLVAGRGIGMDIVKNIIKELKGKIKLNTMEGKFLEYEISIPL